MHVVASIRAMPSPCATVVRGLVACALALVAAGTAHAQPAPAAAKAPTALIARAPSRVVLSGSVRDTTGARIPYATLRWEAGSLVTNDSGAFEVRGIADGPARFSVRRIGFEPIDFEATLSAANPEDVIIQMRPIVLPLESVDVSADADDMRGARLERVGFYDRLRRGRGTFVGPDEIERRRPETLSDVLLTAPGVTMVGRRRSHNLQFYSTSGCRMNVFLDGHAVSDLGDDMLNGSDIKAVEVYSNATSAPPQFVTWDERRGYCGSIVVWTK